MTRAASGDIVTVAPSNNVYTVLAGFATLVVLFGLVILYVRAMTLDVKFW